MSRQGQNSSSTRSKNTPTQRGRRLQKEIRALRSPKRAEHALRYFKCGKGQYGEGDVFLGLSVPDCRRLAKKSLDVDLAVLEQLLVSRFHEERLLALLILVTRYQRADSVKERRGYLRFYLSQRSRVNNWDLVDTSAYKILGHWCHSQGDLAPMRKLLQSKRHWDRRMAIVATLAFIRQGEVEVAFQFAAELLSDPEDLMHKATGWMLREAGRHHRDRLREFLSQNIRYMPRTMLRYSIEHMSPTERAKWLAHPL